ncbi:hypothetical protein DRP77_03530 [Candidatus Poribacteria bacterium]|nr:MAG: hypothetical protein DRP77_03530 [Candidatus Poribacteria bacterium]
MGIAYAAVKIKKFRDEAEPIELMMKVDSGSLMLTIPEWVQREFDFPLVRKERVRFADGRTAELDVVADVELEVCGRRGVFEALVLPGREYGLLGAVVMGVLDLILEPRELKLYPNPCSPEMPMTELE